MLRDLRPSGRSSLPAVLCAVLMAAAAWLPAAPAEAQDIAGAGSTFVQPLLNRWSQDYLQAERTAEFQPVGSGLDYEAVGSQAGVMRLTERAVDFAATEVPLSDDELARYAVRQFPIVVGGIVVAVNIEGLGDAPLRLNGEVLADIYLGKVTSWADPAVAALNPDMRLPDARITPVRRADGSGTTYAFTDFLARASAAWRPIGVGQTVAWPTGLAAKGNDGVARTVRETKNAIGYVDFASAQRAGLRRAALLNRAGRFVVPEPEAFRAAAAGADWRSGRASATSLVDAAGEGAYPIVAVTYVVLPAATPPGRATRSALTFFDWGLERGASAAAGLGYVPLPPPAVEQVRASWSAAKR
ncbi:phosphate ABC transporter substrate-binding protein PstS [Methylobacterium oryzisoli]|uniref:phosphate ABC transporter substrate-binding protein PstS n=1 Tax=Methylobacterium oryzisoli TaxID=3385502 RepID=UPI0038915A79